ncbi:MAG: DUF4097 family beta strand repeat-containing protein [Candidatus Acidiferrales bacterium]
MARVRASLLVSFALLSLPLLAAAQQEEIVRTFPAPSGTVVEVRNQTGRVVLESWNEPQVKVIAVRRSRAVEVHFEQASKQIHIHTHVVQSSGAASDRTVDYTVWAPANVQLKITLDSGSLQIADFREDVTIETVAANVLLRNLSGYTSVKSLNGAVQVENSSGRLEATSISGNLSFRDLDTRYLAASTTSGDISYEGDFRSGGSYDFRNHDGAIEVWAPATASFELTANSVKGEVTSEFPLNRRSHGSVPKPAGARSLLGTVHTGEALVSLTSFSGRIRLRKR